MENYLFASVLVTLWFGLMAVSSLVFRTLGWTKLKQYPLATIVLILSLLSIPFAGVIVLARPHARRIVAMLHPLKSSPIIFPNGCSLLPQDNIWNVSVRKLPEDPRSDQYIETMGENTPLHADFGSAYGFEYSVVTSDEEPTNVTFTEAPSESDPGPYRIPDLAPVEQGPDRHVVAIDLFHCQLYELYAAKLTGSRQWEAGSGAIFDLRSNLLRTQNWTSADAAGLPILAGLVRYDEVASGVIRHALRFTTPLTRNAFVWPARHQASQSSNPNFPPMGQRFRLRSSFDETGFSSQAQVILAALKEYGMMVADNGGPWYLSGVRDGRWSSSLTSEFRRLRGRDFEAVDSTTLMITSESGQARR